MSDDPGEALRQRQLAFVGRVSAGFTHEFKNHLAVINESAGLLSDLFALARRQGISVDHDRCLKIIESIGERVAVAAELTGYVNSFSHRLDDQAVDFSVNKVLTELLALLVRFARQHHVRLILSPASADKPIHNSPALLQFVCYNLLMTALGQIVEGGVIQVRVEQSEAVRITLRAEGVGSAIEDKAGSDIDDALRQAIDMLAAEVSLVRLADGSREATLVVPSLPSA